MMPLANRLTGESFVDDAAGAGAAFHIARSAPSVGVATSATVVAVAVAVGWVSSAAAATPKLAADITQSKNPVRIKRRKNCSFFPTPTGLVDGLGWKESPLGRPAHSPHGSTASRRPYLPGIPRSGSATGLGDNSRNYASRRPDRKAVDPYHVDSQAHIARYPGPVPISF